MFLCKFGLQDPERRYFDFPTFQNNLFLTHSAQLNILLDQMLMLQRAYFIRLKQKLEASPKKQVLK